MISTRAKTGGGRMSDDDFKIEITHDGMWPLTWSWKLRRSYPWAFRCGDALTKDRALRRALEAKRSVQTVAEDVTLEDVP